MIVWLLAGVQFCIWRAGTTINFFIDISQSMWSLDIHAVGLAYFNLEWEYCLGGCIRLDLDSWIYFMILFYDLFYEWVSTQKTNKLVCSKTQIPPAIHTPANYSSSTCRMNHSVVYYVASSIQWSLVVITD